MTVTTSYPGVYIEELPNLTHSIVPSPTSVAVFVGYTHPFLTPAGNYKQAIPLFSRADYARNFGGLFSSPWQPDYVGQAVAQFFDNGGSTCYVVGLPATQYYSGGSPVEEGGNPVEVGPATATANVPGGGSITFTAKQPVGVAATAPATGEVGIAMQVAISNLQPPSANTSADIVVSYGSTVETYRQVPIGNLEAALA